jgi:hypothetical protein
MDVRVEQPDNPAKGKNPVVGNPDFRVEQMIADLRINPRTADGALSKVVRYAVIPHIISLLFLGWVLVGLLRDLCDRAANGEIFTEDNLKSVRNLGVVLLASVVVDGGFALFAKIFLNEHLPALSGSNLQLRLDWRPSAYLFDLIPGLLVLLVAEAFRQGLALKKENDLTV